MSKSSIQILAQVLAAKDNLSFVEAERFVRQMFDIAYENIEADKLLKMKWLGTFKVLSVKDRESVDVNTGERIVIEGRDKISFTPDAILKEIINKPFALFDTVVVNDGVEFGDIDAKYQETAVLPQLEENKDMGEDVSELPAETEEQAKEIVEIPTPLPTDAQKVGMLTEEVEEKIEDTPTETEQPVENTEGIEDENVQPTIERHGIILPKSLIAVASVALLLLFAGMGWLAFNYGKVVAQRDQLAQQLQKTNTEQVVKPKIAKEPKMPKQVVDTVLPQKPVQDNVNAELKRKAKEDSIRMSQASKVLDEYDHDVRVRTGAYRIVGVSQIVTAKKGQTLTSISKLYLGPGMECYVEALNNTTEIKEGQQVKIPKLELKKRKK